MSPLRDTSLCSHEVGRSDGEVAVVKNDVLQVQSPSTFRHKAYLKTVTRSLYNYLLSYAVSRVLMVSQVLRW